MGADARLCARSHVESVLAIGVEVAISKRQVLAELHDFVISSHLFNVGASRGKVTGGPWFHVKFLVEYIVLVMNEMSVYNLSPQISFSFIIEIAIFVTSCHTKLVIERAAPRLPIAKKNTLIKRLMVDL